MEKTTILIILLLITFESCSQEPKDYLEYNIISPTETEMIKIDSIINDAIQQRAMPGCRLFVTYNNKVLINNSYGYLTYDSIIPVDTNTIYDFASVTKIAASAPCLMKLYQDNKIKLEKPLNKYFKNFEKNGAKLSDALAHQAGLKTWISLRTKLPEISYQYLQNSDNYDIEKAQNEIYNTICNQKLNEIGNYAYSDLSFYLYPTLIKKYYKKEFSEFLTQTFYNPLGIKLCFNPLNKYNINNIAPTENDTIWRKKLIQGTVHDEGAALMGGISGHAGLFGTAQDLAVLMQMYLNKGIYNGHRYFKQETIEKFTSQAFENNRRGLVFDKPPLDININGTPSKKASRNSFGHTGFTGTFTWADPDNKLLIVFLCNSIYPNRSTILSKLDVRTKIHDQLYIMIEKISNNE
ncbi:MAG: serine hydrolase [Bacteroidales bacterium]|nr:serine hydrolase [Bacteroidales bacterium]